MTRESDSAPQTRETLRWLAAAAVLVFLTSCSSTKPTVARQAAVEPPPIEAGQAPAPGPYAPGFDALHYDISLDLPDTGSYVRGTTSVLVRLDETRRDTLTLDFTGLAVNGVRVDDRAAAFRHERGKLHVPVPTSATAGDTIRVQTAYSGYPDDGLILGRNVHGEPTAFADNWPNRARFWFPSIDHPSDKATVRFEIRLDPASEREVVSNGFREPASEPGVWRYVVSAPIPTYTMVVGAADFVVEKVGEVCSEERDCVEVTTWLFPPDAARGAASFRRAVEMLRFYSRLVAPFPYAKLAHVQSATRFGGMENVSAIFYSEDAIAQGHDIESTVAHETAHQWFGDAVTESDWHHLWLSEGFAEYFEVLFFEQADGEASFRARMEEMRAAYLGSGASSAPIVNPSQDNLFGLLNANNYQKGAWVLHMLRMQLGDDDFFDGIRRYYRTFEHATVLTEDFVREMEAASGRDLGDFFGQWVFEPGHPRLHARWSWREGSVRLRLDQVQPAEWPTFEFPLTLEFETFGGPVRRELEVDEREEVAEFTLPGEPTGLDLDPDGALLKEVISVERRDME